MTNMETIVAIGFFSIVVSLATIRNSIHRLANLCEISVKLKEKVSL